MKEFKLFDLDTTDNENIKNVSNVKDVSNVSNIQDIDNVSNAKNVSDIHNIYNPIAAQKEVESKQTVAWRAYQEAIVKAGQLTSDITKGIQSGEKLEILFLKAIECISLITGDKLFYELNKSNLKNLYGLIEK